MPNKVKHLRGTLAEWNSCDPVIDEGEIALALTDSGRYRMKIGNGVSPFSALEMFGGEVYYPSYDNPLMKHCADIRYGVASSLTILLPDVFDDDYYSMLTFDSPEVATAISYPEIISFSGESVADGEFVPDENMHYTLLFWYDGRLQCHVRGIHNA